MTSDRKNIDNLFRNGLNGYREKPPMRAWQRLEQDLFAASSRRRMAYIRLAAASVLILMAFGAGYYFAIYLKQPVEVVKKEVLKDAPKPSQGITGQEVTSTGEENGGQPKMQPGKQEPSDMMPAPKEVEKSQRAQEPDILMAESRETGERETIPPAIDQGPAGNRDLSLPLPTMTSIHPGTVELAQLKPVYGIQGEKAGDDNGYAGLFYYPEDYDLKPAGSKNKWSVGAQFAPTYSYREISANYGTNLAGNQQDVENLNNIEEGLLSYAGGVDVGYNFSGNWSVQSGVYFSRIGQANNDALTFKQSKNEFLLYSISTSTGNINVAFDRVPENVKKINAPKDSIGAGNIADVKVIQNFDLFEVPLLIRYKFLNRKFSMNLTGGLSPAYLLANNTYLELQDNKYDVGDAGNLNSMIVNTSLGMGFEYSFTRKFSVNFEPTFKYSLNPINNGSNIDYHPYYFSWFTGIRLKID